jgi:hypothetical protein
VERDLVRCGHFELDNDTETGAVCGERTRD